jgi:small subunit ribosomal protein S6
VLLNIEAPAGVVAELERQTAINEDVIRWLTMRVDEHETGPSVQMRKQDRERRRAATARRI